MADAVPSGSSEPACASVGTHRKEATSAQHANSEQSAKKPRKHTTAHGEHGYGARKGLVWHPACPDAHALLRERPRDQQGGFQAATMGTGAGQL